MAAERQFIGDILADENSDYGQESPREKRQSPRSDKSKSEKVKSEPSQHYVNNQESSDKK